MEKIWVLAADNSRARIFETTKRNTLEKEIETMVHPAGRQSVQEMTTDRPGRSPHPSGGEKRVAYAPTVDLKKYETQQFARSLSQILNKGSRDNKFQKLYIVAPPSFLGMLRSGLDSHVRERIKAEIDKNLTQLKMDAIREHLPEYM